MGDVAGPAGRAGVERAGVERAGVERAGVERDEAVLASQFKALSDPSRLRLLSIIATAASGEVCACDLPSALDRSQPTVSHHLRQLVEAGLLEREQRGKWAWFRLRADQLDAIAAAVAHLGAPVKPGHESGPTPVRPVRGDEMSPAVHLNDSCLNIS